MEIKLSDINSLKMSLQPQNYSSKWIEKSVIIVLAILLAVGSWYILKSISTVLVIKKNKPSMSNSNEMQHNAFGSK